MPLGQSVAVIFEDRRTFVYCCVEAAEFPDGPSFTASILDTEYIIIPSVSHYWCAELPVSSRWLLQVFPLSDFGHQNQWTFTQLRARVWESSGKPALLSKIIATAIIVINVTVIRQSLWNGCRHGIVGCIGGIMRNQLLEIVDKVLNNTICVIMTISYESN